MTPEQKIEAIAGDAREMRGMIGDLSRRIGNMADKVDRNFSDLAKRIRDLEARIPAEPSD